jgi:hypothetical protein
MMDEYKQTVGTNSVTTSKLKGVATAKNGDKLGGYHKEDGMIGDKLDSSEVEADVIFLEDYGMKGISVSESDVS